MPPCQYLLAALVILPATHYNKQPCYGNGNRNRRNARREEKQNGND